MEVSKMILNGSSPKESYDKLFTFEVGQIFKIESDYETVMERIESYKPENLFFRVFPITPGTSLFTLYGPDHCIVTSKHLID